VVENVLGEPVIRDAHRRHAAGLGQGLEHRHRVAQGAQAVSCRQARGSRSHHGHLLFLLVLRGREAAAAGLEVRIRGAPLQEPDGQGLVDVVPHAGALAGMRAGPADDPGQDAPLPDQVEGVGEAAVPDQLDVAGNVQRGRTGLHAGGRYGDRAGLLFQLPALGEGQEIALVVFDRVEYRRQGGSPAEIALAVFGYALCDLLDLPEGSLVGLAGGHVLQERRHPVDADHADGALTAGQLPGFLQVSQGQRGDVRVLVQYHQAVPSHEGRHLLAFLGDGTTDVRRSGLALGLALAAVNDLSVPTAECNRFHVCHL
jgi:hypothetical protein